MKTLYMIGAAALALVVVSRMGSREAKRDQLQATIPYNGTDWMGDMWGRLSGADLGADGYPNMHTGPVADPGRIGLLQTGIVPTWNGGIA